MTLEELKSFVAVAEAGTFSAAARRIGKAQSVLSVHIAGLEAELGYALFDRHPKPAITAKGRALLMGARRVLAESQRLELRAKALHGSEDTALYMGVDLELEAPVMLDIFKAFSFAFPAVRLQLENLTGSEMTWFFKKSSMNMLLVYSSEPAIDSDEVVIGESQQQIVVGKNHPLAKIAAPTAEDLKHYRQLIVNARDSEAAPPLIVSEDYWEVDSGLWVLEMVVRNLGWAILPQSMLSVKAALKAKITTVRAPFDLLPLRLVLRTKPGEVSPAMIDWWTRTLKKNSTKLGISPI